MNTDLTTAEMRARLELIKNEAVAYKRVHMPHVFFQVDEAIEALNLALEALARREREEEEDQTRKRLWASLNCTCGFDTLDRCIIHDSPVTNGGDNK